MRTIGNAIGWAFGCFLLLMSLVFQTQRLGDPGGVLYLIGGLALLPPVRRRISGFVQPFTPLFASVLSFLLFIAGCLLVAEVDKEGVALGFADGPAYRRALALGLTSPQELAAHNAAEATRKAHEEQQAADRRAREEQQAAAKRAAEERNAAAAASIANESCRKDLQCLGDKHLIKASFTCAPMVERLAQYQHEWTDGMLEAKFSRFRWKNKNTGVVTFLGDRIKFQNGFGAWQFHIYTCDFDTASETVLSVNASPGRLPE
ncbi:hypothetical protein [Hyphomicrobium sp.]|uniref:hypothetical protein n=1 Tax=Hyphomicrobium sp. TaxID=82 RepID=UPI002E2FBFCD|nr:hypothetical protein [Hyphomicrobium sp.]HEX2842139.1 hypothetical protein [Hyphomicrobium sp.]